MERLLIGSGHDFMATRIAYRLGLTGPALSVSTGCSSSLVATHQAIQALNGGDCDQAIVVAASVGFPQTGHLHVPGGVASADGHCRPFDADATGTVWGSGAVALVLRRFDEVGADVPSHGVIVGSAINNDGAGRAGFSAPSANGQAEVIRAALRSGEIDPGSIGYVEAHGTGTYVGDPIEWSSMSDALLEADAPIPVGAVKANIGHLDAASGLAAVVKALHSVRRGWIPPVAGFTRLNPLLADLESPLYVPVQAHEWRGPGPRRAGVSSWGIGGTNAHLVLEQAPEPPARTAPPAGRDVIVPLSAVRADRLDRTSVCLAEHLVAHDPDVEDVAYTLRTGRAELPERQAVVGASGADIAEGLRGGSGRVVRGRVPDGGAAPLVVLLPGQGAQRPGMAGPFEMLPGFTDALEDCLRYLDDPDEVRSALWDMDYPADRLRDTGVAQPALFGMEYAAVHALEGIGLRPAAFAGHSLGEITAACLAGVFDLETAAGLVNVRASSMRACPPGAMLAANCSEDEAGRLIAATGLELAAVNAPGSCVLSGTHDRIEALERRIGGRFPFRRLRTTHAFHSSMMDPAVEVLRRHLDGVTSSAPTVPFVRNLDGEIVPPGAPVPTAMFADSARATVRFADGAAAVARRFPGAVAVEAGPGQALSGMVTAAGLTAVPLASGRDTGDGGLALGLAALWTTGQPVDLAVLSPGGRRIHLPVSAMGGDRHVAPEARSPVWEPERPPAVEPFPATPERVVADAWRDLLGHGDLTDDADFFARGGDSLIGVRLARRLESELGVEVPIRDLMLAPTLGEQIRLVRRLAGTDN